MRGDPTTTLAILVAGLIGLETELREPPTAPAEEDDLAGEPCAGWGVPRAAWELS